MYNGYIQEVCMRKCLDKVIENRHITIVSPVVCIRIETLNWTGLLLYFHFHLNEK